MLSLTDTTSDVETLIDTDSDDRDVTMCFRSPEGMRPILIMPTYDYMDAASHMARDIMMQRKR